MQSLLTYFQDFVQLLNKPFLVFCTLFAALIITLNYKWGIEPKWLAAISSRPSRFLGFYTMYLLAFTIPYLFYWLFVQSTEMPRIPWLLILLAPAIFALKVTAGGWQEIIRQIFPPGNSHFIIIIMDWPVRLLITVSILIALHYLYSPAGISLQMAFGITTENFKWWPYVLLLAAAVPLVAYAANQTAFLQTYPRLKALRFLEPGGPSPWQKILYEISYGSDFLTIELFFRGFLVVFLTRYIGPAAILPMAVFYCSIHFGKPILECISSYFGGLLLGVIACYSQSILGGIIVHLGLAWMMEVAAILASTRFLKP